MKKVVRLNYIEGLESIIIDEKKLDISALKNKTMREWFAGFDDFVYWDGLKNVIEKEYLKSSGAEYVCEFIGPHDKKIQFEELCLEFELPYGKLSKQDIYDNAVREAQKYEAMNMGKEAFDKWIDVAEIGKKAKDQFRVAEYYAHNFKGIDLEKVSLNYQQAIVYYEQAARKNYPEAEFRLYELYIAGEKDVMPDRQKAMMYLHRASEHGYLKAAECEKILQETAEKEERLREEEELKQAQEEIRRDEEQQRLLAEKLKKEKALEQELQIRQQKEKVLAFYQNTNYVAGKDNQLKATEYFQQGRRKDGRKFIDIAYECFRLAAEDDGNPLAFFEMGTMVENGLGSLKTDLNKAIELYHQAADNNVMPNVNACKKLSEIYDRMAKESALKGNILASGEKVLSFVPIFEMVTEKLNSELKNNITSVENLRDKSDYYKKRVQEICEEEVVLDEAEKQADISNFLTNITDTAASGLESMANLLRGDRHGK